MTYLSIKFRWKSKSICMHCLEQEYKQVVHFSSFSFLYKLCVQVQSSKPNGHRALTVHLRFNIYIFINTCTLKWVMIMNRFILYLLSVCLPFYLFGTYINNFHLILFENCIWISNIFICLPPIF